MTETVGRPTASDRFVVVTVCVGNICRSPVAALLLQHTLGSLVRASSAGTHAVVGAGVHPPMARLLTASGVSPDGRARQLTESMLRSADLVLTMTRELRRQAVGLCPAAMRRAFTLPELAALSDQTVSLVPDPGRSALVAAVAAAATRRSSVAALGDALDIADPYGGSQADYERAFAEIQRCVEVLGRAWSGTGATEKG